MSEVIELAASKRVQNLTKGNEDNFIKAFQITGIAIFLDSEIFEAKKLFQIRHLYTHRNGRVDEKFLSKVSATELTNGDEYKISVEDFCKAIHFFIDIVNRVDTEAINRHGLETLDEEEES
jgi:hypothetical protein